MLSRPTPLKIRPEHLDRPAFIYVRQSTLVQVRDNTASTARQYDLVQRALDLGWPREHITVIDQDPGHSGASTVGRDGFQFLISEVGLGHAGAVLSLEASRLARSCSDWYRLIEICALADTLVIDEEGVYDPSQYNDRLLLGFKGTMSEAELHWLRSRLLGGKLEKAQKGQLRVRPPTGFIYDPVGQLVLDPDQQVQQTIRLALDWFDQSGSALAVVQHFATQHLLFPTRAWGGTHHDELTWQPLSCGRILAILHNPTYAGVYVYGRTQTRTARCRVKRRASRDARAACNYPIGPLSCQAPIPVTSLGNNSCAISNVSPITAPFAPKSTVAHRAKGRRCSQALSCVVAAGGACPCGICLMA